MLSNVQWKCRKNCNNSDLKECKTTVVSEHPLLFKNVSLVALDRQDDKSSSTENITNANETKLVTTSWNGIDPLSAALSSFKDSYHDVKPNDNSISAIENKEKISYIDVNFTGWPEYKNKILNKFNTTEKLSIKSSFLSDNNAYSTKLSQNVSQKSKNKFEQLDDFEEGTMNEMLNLSQQEYIKRIGELNVALNVAWENDQKVKALKIAIQCAKQLSSTNVILFYPSKFVLITDILDSFGKLVFYRISSKSTEDMNFAQETCRNWFYKISSIRELLPRFYIETSILKVYSFLIDDSKLNIEYEKFFNRLTKMIRGIGDPLVATYCRVYLCRTVIELFPQAKNVFRQNIYDILSSIDQLICTSVQQNLLLQKVDYSIYYTLYTPALDWILSCLFYKANDLVLEQILTHFKDLSNSSVQSGCSALVLNSLINNYPPYFISKHLIDFIEFIKHINKDVMLDDGKTTTCTSVYPKYILIKNIGESLSLMDNLSELDSNVLQLTIDEVWKIIRKLKSKYEYISCFETWSEIIAKYFEINELNNLLGDIVITMLPGREFENYSSQLYTILEKVVRFGSSRIDYTLFFSMTNLIPYLDLFHKENVKVDACKIIVDSFIKSFNCDNVLSIDSLYFETTSDPIILNSITYFCKLMHDSINALTLEDEKRQISNLITGFIRRVSFNRDFEAQLNFYVECRANFSNLDHVLCFLVQQINTLAIQTHQIVKGCHTKKTISFVNACIAFSYITIPSIEDLAMKLQLYLSSCYISLINVCLPQTDAFLKSAITLFRQLPSHSEAPNGKLYSNDAFVYSYICQLLSTLIVVPDNPDLGILYLFKGLFNVIKEYKFDGTNNYKFLIWISMLRYLSTCALDNYPYHADKVDSNDTLYTQGDDFMKEIHSYCDIIFKEILEFLKTDTDPRRQCLNALEVIDLIINYGNIEEMIPMANHLWNWVSKSQNKHNIKGLDNKKKTISELLNRKFTKINTCTKFNELVI